MTSPLYSQQASIDTCCVPCVTLRKALIIKEERTYCGKQLGFARDSITVLEQVILHKDTIISFKDSTIATYVENENKHRAIIMTKDSTIEEYKKAYLSQRIQKYITYGVSSIILLIGILY
tara:strand:+ start:2007 stop:2366 length:360 start_codon:yes stop_codon:yes gene_type:complete